MIEIDTAKATSGVCQQIRSIPTLHADQHSFVVDPFFAIRDVKMPKYPVIKRPITKPLFCSPQDSCVIDLAVRISGPRKACVT